MTIRISSILSDHIRSTVRSMVHLASTHNTDMPLQINARQCQLLANKASEILADFEEFLLTQDVSLDNPGKLHPIADWIPAAIELHRVLEDAKSLIQTCCCGDQWLEVTIDQGNLKETFAKILQDLEWHMSVLWSLLVTEGDAVKRLLDCQGNPRISHYFNLQAAAKHDLASLRHLLDSHIACDGKICKSHCLAIKLVEKLDAEGRGLVDRKRPLESNSPHVLWIKPTQLREGSRRQPELGRGGFARVKETKWLGKAYAWKIFTEGKTFRAAFMQEMAIMAGLNHPHVVRIVCCSEDDHDIGIVMELMDKSLHDLLQDFRRREHPFPPESSTPFSISQSVDLMLQIAVGMRFIHDKGLAHRDIKSLNILIQMVPTHIPTGNDIPYSFIAKIADFGLTKMKNDSTAYGNQTLNLGTRKWMAPEVPIRNQVEGMSTMPAPAARFHPKKLDVYAFGIVCSEILSGQEPYGQDIPSHADVKTGVRPHLPSHTPDRLAALIKQCWSGTPRHRPDFLAICTELRFIQALLLRGDECKLQQTKLGIGYCLNVETSPIEGGSNVNMKVQGPWGGNGGSYFFDGMVTSIRQISLKYDSILMRIWYIEMEYNVNGTSFFAGHGDGNPFRQVRNTATIEIDDSCEYITHLEGAFATTTDGLPPPITLTTISSLTIHTNKKSHGPFGGIPEGATLFKSGFGKVIGFYGKSGLELDAIGCFIVPIKATGKI